MINEIQSFNATVEWTRLPSEALRAFDKVSGPCVWYKLLPSGRKYVYKRK